MQPRGEHAVKCKVDLTFGLKAFELRTNYIHPSDSQGRVLKMGLLVST